MQDSKKERERERQQQQKGTHIVDGGLYFSRVDALVQPRQTDHGPHKELPGKKKVTKGRVRGHVTRNKRKRTSSPGR